MSFQTLIKYGSAPLANNQVNFADIIGLKIDGTKNPVYVLEYTITRLGYTGGDIIVKGTINGKYQPPYTSWFTVNVPNLNSTVTVTLYQAPGGQFKFSSTNLGGSPTYDRIAWTLRLL